MEQKLINPWQWQQQFSFSQGVEVSWAQRILYCAGQASFNAEGGPLHAGDMRTQIPQAFDNLETVLTEAEFSLANVVRLNFNTTDVDRFLAEYDVVNNRLQRAGCQPASTLLGVMRLALPELLIEIEATAVK